MSSSRLAMSRRLKYLVTRSRFSSARRCALSLWKIQWMAAASWGATHGFEYTTAKSEDQMVAMVQGGGSE
ncbi:MAG: hypothetical protein M1598_01565 [Actinobacteria bacterium]|nr:hypothetical protein [Actinomycetota bacterium]